MLYTQCTRGGAAHHMHKEVRLTHCPIHKGWGSIVHTCTSLRSEVVDEGTEVALSSSDVDKTMGSCHAETLPAIFFTH